MKKRVKKPECPNCGQRLHVEDNFCPKCGQENHTHKLPLKHYAMEFIESLFHFDTKLWQTVKEFFAHPGLATKNFNDNKRARYVPPFRLYLFVSAIYFLILSLVPGVVHINLNEGEKKTDGVTIGATHDPAMAELAKKDSVTDADIEQYILKEGKQPNWLNKKMAKLSLKIQQGKVQEETMNHKLIKNISILMFFLMPLFALLLMLLYYKKQLFYSEHLLFSVHYHTLAFIVFIVIVLLNSVLPVYITPVALVTVFIYLLLSLKNVYQQGWPMTIFKTALLTVLYVFFLVVGMAGAALVSI